MICIFFRNNLFDNQRILKNKISIIINLLTAIIGGEGGIRTLDTLLAYTHFPGVLLQPLGHLTI